MKSAIAFGVSVTSIISLQGCGSGGDVTTSPITVVTTTSGPCVSNTDTYECPATLSGDFDDLSDGTTKTISLADGKMTITDSSGVTTEVTIDTTTCRGDVDENQTVAVLKSFAAQSGCDSQATNVLSLSAVGDTTYLPVNQWIEKPATTPQTLSGTQFLCFPSDEIQGTKIFSDMHDGDQKNVAIDCSSGDENTCALTITPHAGGDWSLSATIDKGTCSGLVDFTSKDPAAGTLMATFRVSRFVGQPIHVNAGEEVVEYFIGFADPTTPTVQVNQWVESGGSAQRSFMVIA